MFSGYFKTYFALLIVASGSLLGMDQRSRYEKGQTESRSGSARSAQYNAAATTTATAATPQPKEDEPQTDDEAIDLGRAIAASLRGHQTDAKKQSDLASSRSQSHTPAVQKTPHYSGYRMHDGTEALDCRQMRVNEHPRFKAQEQLFARINQYKAHHEQAEKLWKADPANAVEAEKQLKEINAIRENVSQATILKDLKALRAINATQVVLPYFAQNGLVEYQTPAQALGRAVIEIANIIDGRKALVAEACTQALNFSASQAHKVIDRYIKRIETADAVAQFETIIDLVDKVKTATYEELLTIVVALQSITPSQGLIEIKNKEGKKCPSTITQVQGINLLIIMRIIKHPELQTYEEALKGDIPQCTAEYVYQGFDKAIEWINHIIDVDTENKAYMKDLAEKTEKEIAQVAAEKKLRKENLLKAMENFNQNASADNKSVLLAHMASEIHETQDDTAKNYGKLLLERIKMYLEQDETAKAQTHCRKYIEYVNKDQKKK